MLLEMRLLPQTQGNAVDFSICVPKPDARELLQLRQLPSYATNSVWTAILDFIDRWGGGPLSPLRAKEGEVPPIDALWLEFDCAATTSTTFDPAHDERQLVATEVPVPGVFVSGDFSHIANVPLALGQYVGHHFVLPAQLEQQTLRFLDAALAHGKAIELTQVGIFHARQQSAGQLLRKLRLVLRLQSRTKHEAARPFNMYNIVSHALNRGGWSGNVTELLEGWWSISQQFTAMFSVDITLEGVGPQVGLEIITRDAAGALKSLETAHLISPSRKQVLLQYLEMDGQNELLPDAMEKVLREQGSVTVSRGLSHFKLSFTTSEVVGAKAYVSLGACNSASKCTPSYGCDAVLRNDGARV